MAKLCIVKDCRNASSITPKDCQMFSVPKIESLCKQWLFNCKRQDLCDQSVDSLHENHYVCSDHFKCSMFSNPQRTVLFPIAIPTKFLFNYEKEISCSTSTIIIDKSKKDPLICNNLVVTSTPLNENLPNSINSINNEEGVSCSTSYIDMSISDPLFYNNSMATSTPIKQDESLSIDIFDCEEEVSCHTSYVDMSISDPLFSIDSITPVTPPKQNQQTSTKCQSI